MLHKGKIFFFYDTKNPGQFFYSKFHFYRIAKRSPASPTRKRMICLQVQNPLQQAAKRRLLQNRKRKYSRRRRTMICSGIQARYLMISRLVMVEVRLKSRKRRRRKIRVGMEEEIFLLLPHKLMVCDDLF